MSKAHPQSMEFLRQPATANRLGDCLIANFERDWTHFRAAIAFVKRSGVKHVAGPLANFVQSRQVEVIVGIDHNGSSYEGLRDLLAAVQPNGRVIVFHNRLVHTFHPKVYVFKSENAAEVIAGSGNLTEGGLFTNYEASVRLSLDLTKNEHADTLDSVEYGLDQWSRLEQGTTQILDENLLRTLRNARLVPMEASSLADGHMSGASASEADLETASALFSALSEHRAPSAARPAHSQTETPERAKKGAQTTRKRGGVSLKRFVMTLQRTDVGVGQVTPGTSKRSPEIFIPLSARNANPGFWSWPDGFRTDPDKPGKKDRPDVRMHFAGQTVPVNMMTWPDKHDFRLRSTALRDAGRIGDILMMEKVEPGLDFEYYVEIIPQGTEQHARHLIHCTGVVPGRSRKQYGYF